MISSKTNTNLIYTILFILVFLPMMSISWITRICGETFINSWTVFSAFILFFLLLIFSRIITINKFNIYFILYEIVILFSTIVNHGLSYGIIVSIFATILLYLLLQSSCYYHILKAIKIIVIFTSIINFPIMLLNINKINADFFIGGKNALSMFLIPGAFLFLLDCFEYKERLTFQNKLYLVFLFLSVLIGGGGTGLVVGFTTLVLLLVSIKIKPKKIIYISAIIVAFLLLLVYSEEFFSTKIWIDITSYLGKDPTLTARATIWENVKELIRDFPLFGLGRGNEIAYIDNWGSNETVWEAHSFILEILLEGGFVALLLFSKNFINSVFRLDMNNKKHKIIFIAICVILINGLTESNNNNFFVVTIFGIASRMAHEQNEPINRNYMLNNDNSYKEGNVF